MHSPSRILYVLNSTGVGGAEASIKRMVTGRFGDSTVVTLWTHGNAQKEFWSGWSRGKIVHLSGRGFGLFVAMASFVRLVRLIRAGDHAVVQSQLKGADVLVGLTALLGLMPAHVRIVCSLRNSHGYYYGGGWVNRLIGRLHAFVVSRTASHVVSVSRQDTEKFKAMFGDRLTVIENAAELHDSPLKTDYSLDPREIRVLLVGNVKVRKGHDLLPELSAALQRANIPVRFFVAGGIEDVALRQEVEQLCGGRVEFLGKVANIHQRVAQYDFFLSLSRDEGLPISVLEAMKAGVPMLLSAIAAHRLMVDGFAFRQHMLFESTDEAVALFKHFLQETDRRSQFGAALRDYAEVRFSFTRMCDAYQVLYGS